jgi:MFS family permease
LALGPLISGALASATPWPTVSPYVFDIILVLLLLVALTGVPETRPSNGETRHGNLARLPRSIRRRFIGAATLSVTAWAITGWVLALSPAFLRDELHQHDPALSGAVAAVFFVASGAAQLAIRRLSESHATLSALGLELAGMCTALLAVPTGSLAVVFIAVLLAGAGHGAALVTAMGAVLDFAPANARGRVTSTLYVVNYIGLGVPVVACGIIADHFGIATATAFFTFAIASISAISIALLKQSRASDPASISSPPR